MFWLRNWTNSVMPSLKKKTSLLLGALVGELDLDAGIQEGQLPQALGEDLVLEFAGRQEDLGVGLERDLRAGLSGVADHHHLLRRLSLGEAHLVDLAAAPHLGLEPLRNGVHALGADAVQAAGDLVGPLAELAARVEVGEHELEGRYLVDGVGVHRDAAAVVLDRARAVEVDRDLDRRWRSPARASSTELSTTSKTQWCRPRSLVSPMYMSGRLRTPSRPSSFWILEASYASAPACEFEGVCGSVWSAMYGSGGGGNERKILFRKRQGTRGFFWEKIA